MTNVELRLYLAGGGAFRAGPLERSLATLHTGERPIPSHHYEPAALERWVEDKHRQQVDSYRPSIETPGGFKGSVYRDNRPARSPDSYRRRVAAGRDVAPDRQHRGRPEYCHVFIEEIGEGNAREHHANIYRALLSAMGVEALQ